MMSLNQLIRRHGLISRENFNNDKRREVIVILLFFCLGFSCYEQRKDFIDAASCYVSVSSVMMPVLWVCSESSGFRNVNIVFVEVCMRVMEQM
jgi:hypothetical protein